MKMKSLRIVLCIFTLCIFCVGILIAFLWSSSEVKQRKPHIIFIMVDDVGWNDVSFHGADQIPTPNIDALAYNGVILNRYYSQPTCTPSRTAFLTGRYPTMTGMQGFPLRAAEPRGIPLNITLLPEYLKKLGYDTRLIGKWHTGYYSKQHTPAYRGFDSFFGYYNGMIQYYNHTYTQETQFANITGFDLHRDSSNSLNVDYTRGYFTDILSDEAEKIIANHNPQVPLYLQISHLATHCSDAADPLEVRDLGEVNSTFHYIEDLERRKYAGMMLTLDESVGRTVAALDKARMLENSIIVFVSDNGAQTEGFLKNSGSNYPLRGLKFTVYEGGVRVAACIYSSLIKKPSRVSNLFMHVSDWLPTLYSAAGGNPDDLGELDGINQWSNIQYDKRSSREFLLVNIDEKDNIEAAILTKFKIIKGAASLYEQFYGDSGNNDSYPEYNITRVLNSMTNSAIKNIRKSQLTQKTVKELRTASQVWCGEFTQFANCSHTCLFNIFTDPCETEDLSTKYPFVVKYLERKFQKYRKVLVNQTNAPLDPAGFAEHFNFTWMPWRSEEETVHL